MKISCDYLRVTCSSKIGCEQVEDIFRKCGTKPEVERVKSLGFNLVESVPRMGGMWFRRREPFQASRLHGLEYESWEASSFVYQEDVRSWIGKGRCTRVDATVDFPGETLRPAAIRDMFRAGILRSECGRKLVDSEDKGQTLYVGSRESERMLRIYEKGKQLGNEDEILRVEVELKQDAAADAFDDLTREASYQDWLAGAWRAHLERIAEGPLIDTWVKGLPLAELRTHTEDLDPWGTMSALALQYGGVLAALHGAALLVPWVEGLGVGSRWSRRRAGIVLGVVSQDLERLMEIATKRGRL